MAPRTTVALVLLAACGPGRASDRSGAIGGDVVERPDERPSAPGDATPVTPPSTAARDVRADDVDAPAGPSAPACPPDAPYVCPADNARGYACSAIACAPSCERIGCPSGFACLDCGGGAECVPARHTCD